MFEVSKEAGQAGYYQWGLDAGDHQDGWFPYANHTAEWNHRDGEYEEDLLFASMLTSLKLPILIAKCCVDTPGTRAGLQGNRKTRISGGRITRCQQTTTADSKVPWRVDKKS